MAEQPSQRGSGELLDFAPASPQTGGPNRVPLLVSFDRRELNAILNLYGRKVADDVRECLGKLVFEAVIPRNVRLSEAPSHGLPALIYDHSCAGSLAYMTLARELIGRLPQERKAA